MDNFIVYTVMQIYKVPVHNMFNRTLSYISICYILKPIWTELDMFESRVSVRTSTALDLFLSVFYDSPDVQMFFSMGGKDTIYLFSQTWIEAQRYTQVGFTCREQE